jgi:hypothetical protein
MGCDGKHTLAGDYRLLRRLLLIPVDLARGVFPAKRIA